jgi:hypothetical protein
MVLTILMGPWRSARPEEVLFSAIQNMYLEFANDCSSVKASCGTLFWTHHNGVRPRIGQVAHVPSHLILYAFYVILEVDLT